MLHALALVLLVIVVVRLALDLVCLVCRAAIWLLVQVCLLVEAGLERLREPRKSSILEIRPQRTRARVQPRATNRGAAADWKAYSAAYWNDYDHPPLSRR